MHEIQHVPSVIPGKTNTGGMRGISKASRDGEEMRYQGRSTKYDGLIRDEINNYLTRMFAFGQINIQMAYSVSPITIIDEITTKYLEACKVSEQYNGWISPFNHLKAELRFYYGTPYIANLIYSLAEYFEHMYYRCMTCQERLPEQWCDMEPVDIRKCIERDENKYWADAAASSWEE